MTRVPSATLDLPVDGLNLVAKTFGDELAAASGEFTLIAFLRHYGCMFGREMIRDIRWATQTIANYPTPLFVGLGNCEETLDYMKPSWPEARVICDPERVLFNAFDLGHGSVMQMFGPTVWACHLRASFKGNFFGKFVGDPWIMPGVFVVDRSQTIRWKHDFRHQGDHPNWAKIPSLLTSASVAEPPQAGSLITA